MGRKLEIVMDKHNHTLTEIPGIPGIPAATTVLVLSV
jgi:hypothetical protein